MRHLTRCKKNWMVANSALSSTVAVLPRQASLSKPRSAKKSIPIFFRRTAGKTVSGNSATRA